MNHITQEDIVLSYYGDRHAHLDTCDVCRAELARIAEILDRVEAPEVPEPDAGYESRVWERLSWRLRGEKKRALRVEWMRWGVVAAVVAIAFVAGLLWRNRPAEPTATPVATKPPVKQPENQLTGSTPQQRDRILLVVVGDHFDQSERILVELTNLTPREGTDITAERERAGALLASNRLYRHSAEDRGQETVANVLDDLEPLLMQIAHAPSRLSAEEVRDIQKRVEAKGLVLKLRVIRANVRATAAANNQQPNV